LPVPIQSGQVGRVGRPLAQAGVRALPPAHAPLALALWPRPASFVASDALASAQRKDVQAATTAFSYELLPVNVLRYDRRALGAAHLCLRALPSAPCCQDAVGDEAHARSEKQ